MVCRSTIRMVLYSSYPLFAEQMAKRLILMKQTLTSRKSLYKKDPSASFYCAKYNRTVVPMNRCENCFALDPDQWSLCWVMCD